MPASNHHQIKPLNIYVGMGRLRMYIIDHVVHKYCSLHLLHLHHYIIIPYPPNPIFKHGYDNDHDDDGDEDDMS